MEEYLILLLLIVSGAFSLIAIILIIHYIVEVRKHQRRIDLMRRASVQGISMSSSAGFTSNNNASVERLMAKSLLSNSGRNINANTPALIRTPSLQITMVEPSGTLAPHSSLSNIMSKNNNSNLISSNNSRSMEQTFQRNLSKSSSGSQSAIFYGRKSATPSVEISNNQYNIPLNANISGFLRQQGDISPSTSYENVAAEAAAPNYETTSLSDLSKTVTAMIESIGSNPLAVPGYMECVLNEDFEMDATERLSKGSFGIVYPGKILKKDKFNGLNDIGQEEIVIKEFIRSEVDGENSSDTEIKHEIAILGLINQFHHENIVKFLGYSVGPPWRIIMRRYQLNLRNLMDKFTDRTGKHKHIPAPNAFLRPLQENREFPNFITQNELCFPHWIRIALDISTGLGFLHNSLNMLHLDLKPHNILLQPSNSALKRKGFLLTAVICDFGSARLLENESKVNRMVRGVEVPEADEFTVPYASPEILQSLRLPCTTPSDTDLSARVKKSCDIYSYSMILYEILVGSKVWLNVPIQEIRRRVIDPSNSERPRFPGEAARDSDITYIREKKFEDNTTTNTEMPIINFEETESQSSTSVSNSEVDRIPLPLINLTRRCWAFSPEQRPDISEVIRCMKPYTQVLLISHDL